MLNNVILMGRLTRDPELRYTQTGKVPVVTFTLAVERSYCGNGKETTDFTVTIPENGVYSVVACARHAKGKICIQCVDRRKSE